MGKRFKEYDKAFTKEQIAQCRADYLTRGADIVDCCCWKVTVRQWTQEQVQYAVYEASDHMKWQLFRVSMKGVSTSDKLRMLAVYLADAAISDMTSEQFEVVACQVDNYIGALVRGGQLDTTFRIKKEL